MENLKSYWSERSVCASLGHSLSFSQKALYSGPEFFHADLSYQNNKCAPPNQKNENHPWLYCYISGAARTIFSCFVPKPTFGRLKRTFPYCFGRWWGLRMHFICTHKYETKLILKIIQSIFNANQIIIINQALRTSGLSQSSTACCPAAPILSQLAEWS